MKKTPKILPTYYKSKGTPIFRDTTALPFAEGGTVNKYASSINDIFPTGMRTYPTSMYASSPGRYYGQGGDISFQPSDYASIASVHYDEGGPIYTYAKRPGSYYQKDAQGNWMISNASTNNQYVLLDDPTGQRTALLNKGAVIYNPPQGPQGAPKPVINQAVWNKAQQEGEKDLAAKQFVADVHKQSGTSGLYMPDGSLKPQAAQAADWVPQAIMGAPIAAEVLGAAASIPLGGGVNLGGVANAAGLVHGATQVDDRYKDWQNVATGNMDWKEAALKTGLTGLDFAGAGIPIKNASNIIKTMNAPKIKTAGQTLVGETLPNKIVGVLDDEAEFDFFKNLGTPQSVPINGNKPTVLDLSNRPPAIDLSAWEKAKGQAEVNNWRFVIPDQERDFLISQHAQEFADKFGIPLSEVSPNDVGLYAKLKEAENLPVREVQPAVTRLYGDNLDLHSTFVSQHKPQLDLTPQEEVLVDAYTRGYDSLINNRVPTKGKTFYEQEAAPILEQTILKNKFTDNASLFRGSDDFDITGSSSVLRGGAPVSNLRFSDLQVGDTFIPGSFTSTRIGNFDPANPVTPLSSFTRNNNNLDYVINAPKGQSYLYPNVSNIQNYSTELEAVLPKDLQFTVDKIFSDAERGYLTSIDDMQKGQYYGIGNNKFARQPSKILPSISKFDKIVDASGKRISKNAYDKLIEYHNRNHQPTVPKYIFSIANPYLFGGMLNKKY